MKDFLEYIKFQIINEDVLNEIAWIFACTIIKSWFKDFWVEVAINEHSLFFGKSQLAGSQE